MVSALPCRFTEGSGVAPAPASSLVGKKMQLAGDVGERFLEIGHGLRSITARAL